MRLRPFGLFLETEPAGLRADVSAPVSTESGDLVTTSDNREECAGGDSGGNRSRLRPSTGRGGLFPAQLNGARSSGAENPSNGGAGNQIPGAASPGRSAGPKAKTLDVTVKFDFRRFNRSMVEVAHSLRLLSAAMSGASVREIEQLCLKQAGERRATADPYLHVYTQTVRTPTGTVCKVVTKRLGGWGNPNA